MQVLKRSGEAEIVMFDKISIRLQNLVNIPPALQDVDHIVVAKKTIAGIHDMMHTRDLDILSAEIAESMSTIDPSYSDLASRIYVSNMHKETPATFSETLRVLYNGSNGRNDSKGSVISKWLYDIVCVHKNVLDAAILHENDYTYTYQGLKTLERTYLLKREGRLVERPQYMLMRTALEIHRDSILNVLETYIMMSRKQFIHATPTLFNSGTNHNQLASCFLLTMKDDSIEGIYDTLKQCALISKSGGGIGLSVHNIRADGSYIRGTGGYSNGLVPMLRVFNNTARYVDQGGNKRPGSFAIYVEPWHGDIESFLTLKLNHGKEESRARDLFYALWIPDLFMERVQSDGEWTLFSPSSVPGLEDKFGSEFSELYVKYECDASVPRKRVKARSIWKLIIDSQIETGTPYMLYKDACNMKSNQKNLGTIRSSNLCTEIIQYSSRDEIAVCNLASVSLPYCIVNGMFDYKMLMDTVRVVTRNLNRVIDVSMYPLAEARNSNMRHRPIGIGVQGLADVYMILGIEYESEAARDINANIFECIYYAALDTSCDLARVEGVYSSYVGSPISQGILQQDMWDSRRASTVKTVNLDWDALRMKISQYGVRNSLLVAPMPTASTSQILGLTESFEPINSNMYTRRVLSGEFSVVNKYLIRDLKKRGLWNEEVRKQIIINDGSVQNIDQIPLHVRKVYKTVWEISQKSVIEMSADRAVYIDQSQSLNIHLSDVDYSKLTSMHFFAWKKKLKTGMYYLRTKSATNAFKVTVEKVTDKNIVCTEDVCTVCTS